MAHIKLPEGIPGIRSLAMYRPETGQYIFELVQILLRGESSISEAERELIAAYVSSRNNCNYCMKSHAAAARFLFGDKQHWVNEVLTDIDQSTVPQKLKALLHIAGKVQILGKEVKEEDIMRARSVGANDREIHDTVLIAASFSMFNRYADGLASWTPTDPGHYEETGRRLSQKGYVFPQPVN
ncbi:MAG: carboxymuconolactone decarboxylase [Bacteroidetes bacterium]|nr:MAG: carboxymuconolactone decarboxylase [Bacteroidota bacterium]